MDNCFCSINKYLIFFANFLFFLLGVTALGLGVYALVDGEALTEFLNVVVPDSEINIIYSAAVLTIVVSSFVVLITFLGCCGAVKENKCLLGLFMACIVALFACMIGGIVLGSTGTELIDIKGEMISTMGEYDADATDERAKQITEAWDLIQVDYTCCGVNNATDWAEQNSDFTSGSPNAVPASCCSTFTVAADLEKCMKNDLTFAAMVPGCYEKFVDTIEMHEVAILAGIGAVLALMVANLVLSLMMYCNID
jgi:hypothetical protein